MSLRSMLRVRRQEPIRLLARRHNYFPQRFLWRGHQYNVHNVVEAWTEMKRKGARHFFRVRCGNEVFDIYQDIKLNAWYFAEQVE